jgi:hypothetical protein
MAAPFTWCTNGKQRSLYLFLWLECVKTCEIHRRIKIKYGDKFICHRGIYVSMWWDLWAANEVKEHVNHRIRNNRRIGIEESASEVSVNGYLRPQQKQDNYIEK